MIVAILAAPVASSAGQWEGFALYQAFHSLCHQQAQRSWSVAGLPLAVCVRCFGVYAGLLLGAVAGAGASRRALALALAVMAASWAVEFLGFVEIPAGVRFATGLLVGGGVAAYLLSDTGSRG